MTWEVWLYKRYMGTVFAYTINQAKLAARLKWRHEGLTVNLKLAA